MRLTCTAADALQQQADGSVACVITDPPWALQGGGRFEAVAAYERQSVGEIMATLADARRCLLPGGFLFLFAPGGHELEEVMLGMSRHGWVFQRELCWRKGKNGLGAFQSAHEPVLVYSNGKSRGYELSGRYPSVLDWSRPAGRTAKPYQVYRVFLEMATRPGELVLDPYCGTNPLKAACETLQPARRWLAADILPPEGVNANTSDTVRKQRRSHPVAGQIVLAQPVLDKPEVSR